MDGITLHSLEATAADTEGVWRDAGDYEDRWSGLMLKVARMGHPAYQRFINDQTMKLMKTKRRGTPEFVKAMDKISREACAKHLLKDWDRLLDGNGNAIPYSQRQAIKFCTDERYYRMYQVIQEIAADDELFQQEQAEEAEGNSSLYSDTTSDGETSDTEE